MTYIILAQNTGPAARPQNDADMLPKEERLAPDPSYTPTEPAPIRAPADQPAPYPEKPLPVSAYPVVQETSPLTLGISIFVVMVVLVISAIALVKLHIKNKK